jgi:nitroreductase
MFDVGLALQNLTLAAYELGLGTVHVGLFDAQKAAQVMGVPKGVVVVELMPLGYPDEQPAARPRKELAGMVFYEKYGQTQ